jgi:hypothetical protein
MGRNSSVNRIGAALRSRHCSFWCAAAILVAAAIHPPDGLGPTLCWMRNTTGVPCPGCGLTRSLSCTLQGRVADAVSYHPFGPLVIAVLAFALIGGLLPVERRDWLRARMARWAPPWRIVVLVALLAFVSFGVFRAGRWVAEHAFPSAN